MSAQLTEPSIKNTPALVYISLFLGITLLIFSLGIRKDEVGLCREIFRGLVERRQYVERFIDWEKFMALGVDIGGTYAKLPNEKEKSLYRREFFKNLSLSFKQQGGSSKTFSNWRVYERKGANTIVAADYKAQANTLLFFLYGERKKKLYALQWENKNPGVFKEKNE